MGGVFSRFADCFPAVFRRVWHPFCPCLDPIKMKIRPTTTSRLYHCKSTVLAKVGWAWRQTSEGVDTYGGGGASSVVKELNMLAVPYSTVAWFDENHRIGGVHWGD